MTSYQYVFKKDQAMGARAKTFADVRSNVPPGFEDFTHVDLNDITTTEIGLLDVNTMSSKCILDVFKSVK